MRAPTDVRDDSFLVLEGTLSVTLGDGEDARELRAGPGTFVHAPGGFDRRIGLR